MTKLLTIRVLSPEGYQTTPADDLMGLALRLNRRAQAGDHDQVEHRGTTAKVLRAWVKRGRLVVEVEPIRKGCV